MKQKLKYRFDNFMSRGTGVLIGGLALVTLVMIVAISFVVWITDSAEGASFPYLLWLGVQRSLDRASSAGIRVASSLFRRCSSSRWAASLFSACSSVF